MSAGVFVGEAIRAIDEEGLRVVLLARIEKEAGGSQKDWAAANGTAPQVVNDFLRRRQLPGRKILAALGYRQLTVFARGEE